MVADFLQKFFVTDAQNVMSDFLFEDSLKIISSAIFGNYFLKCLQSFIMSVSEQQFFFIEHCFLYYLINLFFTQKIKIKGHSLNVILN